MNSMTINIIIFVISTSYSIIVPNFRSDGKLCNISIIMHEVQSTLLFFKSECYFLSLDQISCKTEYLDENSLIIHRYTH